MNRRNPSIYELLARCPHLGTSVPHLRPHREQQQIRQPIWKYILIEILVIIRQRILLHLCVVYKYVCIVNTKHAALDIDEVEGGIDSHVFVILHRCGTSKRH